MVSHSRKVHDSRRELARLETGIRDMKIEFDKFFNGALHIPPEDFRYRVQRHIRELRTRRLKTAVDRFRLNSLEMRFNVLCELVNRRLREAERSPQRGGGDVNKAGGRGFNARNGIDLEGTENRAAIESLYSELYSTSGRHKKIDFDSFQQYLGGQIEKLRAKTGCEKVQFRVAAEGSKLKLKAKPLRGGPRRSES